METELYHYGVKGQKWGVRRYRNKNGSLTSAGKKKAKANREDNKKLAKKIAVATLATATVAAAAYAYSRNPEAVNKFVSNVGKKTMSALKKGSQKSIDLGKTYVKESIRGVKDGIKEGVYNAPKKAAQAVITGVVMNAVKKALDDRLGKKEAEKIFKANNPKKIDSFWKVQQDDKKDDDD